jgi:hypothetical protein
MMSRSSIRRHTGRYRLPPQEGANFSDLLHRINIILNFSKVGSTSCKYIFHSSAPSKAALSVIVTRKHFLFVAVSAQLSHAVRVSLLTLICRF